MQNEYEELIGLYEELEDYRQARNRMAMYGLFYTGGVFLIIVAARPLLRVFARSTGALIVVIAALVVIGVGVGLNLLSNYVKNEVRRRELERELERAKVKAKRRPRREEETHYEVGADGELIEVDSSVDPFEDEETPGTQSSSSS